MSDHITAMEPETIGTILVVDDTPANLRLLFQFLSGANYQVNLFKDGPAALASLEADIPDLILLDIGLPGMNGFEVARRIKADEHTADVPIIFISALDHVEAKIQAFEIGGTDYITKPFHEAEVLARVKTLMSLRQYQQNQLRLQLENERTALITTFIDKASHEFRTPLTNISTSTSILRRLLPQDDPRILRHLDHITAGMQDINQLVDDMLSLVELDAASQGHFERVNLTILLNQMIPNFQARHQTHPLELHNHAGDQLYCHGNPVLLTHALEKIIDNATRFSPPDSVIITSLDQNGRQAELKIIDNGSGIAVDELPHVFDQFYRADQAHTSRGLGLGLPMAKRIIDHHQGTISLDSQTDQGTTVTIMIPLTTG